jgi:hypothetical protein
MEKHLENCKHGCEAEAQAEQHSHILNQLSVHRLDAFVCFAVAFDPDKDLRLCLPKTIEMTRSQSVFGTTTSRQP